MYPSTLEEPDEIIHHFTLKKDKRPKIELSCKKKGSYILNYQHFGLLYTLDNDINHFSSADMTCDKIENPFKKHHKGIDHMEDEELQDAISEKYKAMSQNPDKQPGITNYNIDNQCNHETIWRTEEDRDLFDRYFIETCNYNASCKFDMEKMEYTDPITKETKVAQFSKMIRDSCYNRIYNMKLTSIEYILIASCSSDWVDIPLGEDI